MLAAVLATAVALAGPGLQAKRTVAEITAFGPRPAGSNAELRVHRFAAARLDRLGYEVEPQTFRLPRGGLSRNVVGRSDGRPRVGRPGACRRRARHARGQRQRLRCRRDAGDSSRASGSRRRGRRGPRRGGAHRDALALPPGLGGVLRALSPPERASIRFAVSLDMVGVGTRLRVRGIEAQPNRSARLLIPGASYLRDPLGQSDHAELARAGIPAAWLQWREDRCWHSRCDTLQRISVQRLQAAIDVTLKAAEAAL